ncbi:MAG TPA: hypothetical protein ENI48_10495, partial [Thioploca sp.]|nr:hypothetical protein [Thioploca sp.]
IKRRVSTLSQPIVTVFSQGRSIPFIGLLILIVWLPLPYGSNHGWAWAVMEVWIFGLALLWVGQYLRGLHKLTPVFYKAIPILVIWVIWLIYITFQCTPLPYAWIQWLSPQAAEAYAFFNPTYITLLVDSHSTAVGLLKSLSYVLLFTLTLLVVNTRRRLRWVAWMLVFSGVSQAFYGSVMTLSGLEYGFFHEKVYYREVATGTFINRNHLAGYLVMCLSVGIGLLIAQLGDGKAPSTWRQRVVGLLDWLLSAKMRLRLFLVIMVIALVLTHSRMGNTAFFASLMIAGLLTLLLSKQANRATVILLVSLIVIDLFIVGAWFGVEKVAHRLEQTRFSTEKRDEVDIYSIPYWQDYFWTGSGLGSYYTTFPRYQGADVTGFWDHAHNDYLEFAAETGLIGAWLLGVALLLTLAVVLSALYRRRHVLNRGIAFGVLMAITALLIHSIVDFNLQIPANAATFMLILGLGWVVRYLPSANTRTHRKRQRPSRLVTSVSLSLMAGLIYLIYISASWGMANFYLIQANSHVIGKKNVEMEDLILIQASLYRALRFEPNNPDLLMLMGEIYDWRATKINASQGNRLLQHALEYFLKEAKQRPTNARTWINIAMTKHHLKQYDMQFFAALEHAASLAPWKHSVQKVVVDIGLTDWYRLPRKVQSLVIVTIERGMPVQAKPMQLIIKRNGREWVVCAYLQLSFCP